MASGGSTGDGYMAASAKMTGPYYLSYRVSENALYVGAFGDNNIRRIQLGQFGAANAVPTVGFLTVVVGTANVTGSSGNGGPASMARLYGNAGVAFDSLGNMFIADQVSG